MGACVVPQQSVWLRWWRMSCELTSCTASQKLLSLYWMCLRSMETSIREAKDKKRFYKPTRRATFPLPSGTLARYVRIQVENYEFMHLAEIEVFGSPGTRVKVGKVTHVACGNQVTAVTMAPETDKSYVWAGVSLQAG